MADDHHVTVVRGQHDLIVSPADDARPSEKVGQVEAAESELRRLGLGTLSVHHHGPLARIRVPASDLPAITTEPLRGEIVRAVRSAGFRVVTMDLRAADEPRDV
jgi:uncharacterized protein